jgi:hypothetical protein
MRKGLRSNGWAVARTVGINLQPQKRD